MSFWVKNPVIQHKDENFQQAAVRHWHDAGILAENGRVENADQLYGFAAECAVKSALMHLPDFRAEHGGLQKAYKTHINTLIGKARLQNLQKPYPKLYSLLSTPNLFSDWCVDQRYGSDGAIALETLKKHKEAAKRLLDAAGFKGSRA